MTNQQFIGSVATREFLTELATISDGIARWAQQQIIAGCTVEEVKRKLKQTMSVCERV